MKNNYRIKEIKAMLQVDGKDYSLFYPQIEVEVEKESGALWWKKTIKTKGWYNFYRDGDYILSENNRTETDKFYHPNNTISFNNADDAKKFFEEYEEQRRQATIKLNKRLAQYT